ncbi:hypothetical protein BH20ACT2_BH20ACT2_10640 [soil metagenome]
MALRRRSRQKAGVTVTPDTFTMVQFDHALILATVQRLVDQLGIVGGVRVEIDETTPLGRAALASLDPLVLSVEGGGIEDPKRPRQAAEHRVVDLIGRLLLQARDRLDADFGAPALSEDIALAHQVAWDVHTLGRLERLGHPAQRQRRLYHFRNRHGFTDAADEAFERLWSADRLTWVKITDLSDRASAARQSA